MLKSQNHKQTNHTDEYLRATNLETGEVRWFKNGRKAAIGLGCSHVLIYKAIEGIVCTHAMGWELEWFDKDSPEAKEYHQQLEDEKQAKIDAKQKQREENKAKRKAMRDEMKKTQKELARLQRQKMKEAYKSMCEELKEASKKETWDKHVIVQMTLDGEIVAEYKTAEEAKKATGITTIQLCLKGIQKAAGGYLWRYKNNED